MLVFEERGKPEYPEKNIRGRGENQQQTQPTYGVSHLNPGDIVAGECSRGCATLTLSAKLQNVQTHTVFIDFLSLQLMDERNCFLDFCPLHLQCRT